MRKILDGTLAALCILTVVNTDYASFGVIDGLLFTCMGIAVISGVALFAVSRRKGKQ